MVVDVRYKFKEILRESELQVMGSIKRKKRSYPLIHRSGLPQGLSMSPLLATLGQELLPMNESNTAYADDGIFITDDPSKFYKYLANLDSYGLELAPEKTGIIDKNKEVKFLGTYIHFQKEYVRINDKIISFYDKNLVTTLQKLSSLYVKKPYAWNWDIHAQSFIKAHLIS